MYLPIKKVAEHFSRHPDTIRLWVKNGTFPKPTLLPSGRPAWPDTVLNRAHITTPHQEISNVTKS
jgi:hypothetical protein